MIYLYCKKYTNNDYDDVLRMMSIIQKLVDGGSSLLLTH